MPHGTGVRQRQELKRRAELDEQKRSQVASELSSTSGGASTSASGGQRFDNSREGKMGDKDVDVGSLLGILTKLFA